MPTATPVEYTPSHKQPKNPADQTVLVRIRKERGKYVAHPQRVPVFQGVANVVFVLESAPPNAQLKKIKLRESHPRPTLSNPRPNPFSKPKRMRVMLLTDDNTPADNQARYFKYDLEVKEGSRVFYVDPGIDNEPPPPHP